jgi:hypothetical protein
MTASGEVRPSNVREEMQMTLHGAVRCVKGGVVSVGNPEGLHLVWKPGGEKRWRALQELLNQLAGDHKIDDHAGLEQAVDTAAQIYHQRSALDKADADRLVEFIPKVTEVLFREGNDLRIADIIMDRDGLPLDGAGWSYEKTLDTITRFWRVRADLEQIGRVLRQLPKTRKGDLNLHRMVASLERFWKSLPGKKLTRTFTEHGLAKSEAMRFVESVVRFIDPAAVEKLPNITRHRLKRVAKSRA